MMVLWGVPALAIARAAEPALLVRVKVAAPATPVTFPVTLKTPALLLAVRDEGEANPDASVVPVTAPLKVPFEPVVPTTGLKSTTIPLTAEPFTSCTFATKVCPNTVLMVVLWPLPALISTCVGVRFVRVKGAVTAGTDTEAAVTVKTPAVEFAVKAGAVAIPLTSDVTVATFVKPANAPLALLAGAVKVTISPETAAPPESFTTTERDVRYVVLTPAAWGLPAVTVRVVTAA
jgi:hypothetical protein